MKFFSQLNGYENVYEFISIVNKRFTSFYKYHEIYSHMVKKPCRPVNCLSSGL